MTEILNDIWADAEKRRLFAQICRLVAELVDVPEPPDGKAPLALVNVPAPPKPKEEDDEDEDEDAQDEKPEAKPEEPQSA